MGNRNIFDAALVLRALSETAETADAAEAGVATDIAALFHPLHKGADNADYDFKAVIHNIAVGGDVAPTAVVFIIEVAASSAFASGEKEVGRATWDGSAKSMEILLNTYTIRQMHASPLAFRVRMDLTGGTNPTVDYGCYLTKD